MVHKSRKVHFVVIDDAHIDEVIRELLADYFGSGEVAPKLGGNQYIEEILTVYDIEDIFAVYDDPNCNDTFIPKQSIAAISKLPAIAMAKENRNEWQANNGLSGASNDTRMLFKLQWGGGALPLAF